MINLSNVAFVADDEAGELLPKYFSVLHLGDEGRADFRFSNTSQDGGFTSVQEYCCYR